MMRFAQIADDSNSPKGVAARATWLAVLRRYLPMLAFANLVWEALHLPLYTVWAEGTTDHLLFVVLHCTGGDLLIGLSALTLALLFAAPRGWPDEGFARVVAVATLFGVAYTIFSEWLNLVVRKSWQYSELMPVVPVIDTGLSPLLQWMVLPPVLLIAAKTMSGSRIPTEERTR